MTKQATQQHYLQITIMFVSVIILQDSDAASLKF